MKPEYFVIAFCLILTGAYLTYAKHQHAFGNESTIVINSNGFNEEINYSGKIVFSDDETSIKSISKGGYLKFKENDWQLKADDKNGLITYDIMDNGNKMAIDSSGMKFVVHAIKECIAWGVDADGRMERVYKSGGNLALINALGNLKNGGIKNMYFQKLLQSDSLSSDDLLLLLKKASTVLDSDDNRLELFKKFSPVFLQDSSVMQTYLQAVEGLGSDYNKSTALKLVLNLPMNETCFSKATDIINGLTDENEKANLLKFILSKGQLSEPRYGRMLDLMTGFNDDFQKENLLMQLIVQTELSANNFDKLLDAIGRIRDDRLKEDLYQKMISVHRFEDQQWESLIGQVSHFDGDPEKSHFLILVSQKMPRTEAIKNAYIKEAKLINDNTEYGKAMRVIE
ncbi:MAG: hypothetical protein JST58_09715 [Bacteroidetes bacterium]|nr:hypothetical protein [Bacteroidota bacterium]